MISFQFFITRCRCYYQGSQDQWQKVRKIPEPRKVQRPSSHLIHIHHDFEGVFSWTANYIKINTKCAYFRLEQLPVDGTTGEICLGGISTFKVWFLDEASRIHQVEHVAEIEFLLTFQFMTLLMAYSRFNNSSYYVTNIHLLQMMQIQKCNMKFIIQNDPSTKISMSAIFPVSAIVRVRIWFAPHGLPHSDLVSKSKNI